MLLSWPRSGFGAHRSRRVDPEEREDIEHMTRYILRNPFSTAKMHFEPGAGSVIYRSRMSAKQGVNFVALSPTDFILLRSTSFGGQVAATTLRLACPP